MSSCDYFDIAENYYLEENYEKALIYFKRSLEIDESYDCLNYIGCCYLALDNYKQAIEIFKKMSDDYPSGAIY